MRGARGVTRHVIFRKHAVLARGDSYIVLCSPRFRPRSRGYGIWLLRGRGYLWEKVENPSEKQDLQEWWDGLGLDRDGH